jgi:hypothetical protein
MPTEEYVVSRKILLKLDEILETLHRIEQRQILVKKEIEETAPPVVGSFASTDSGVVKGE